MWVDLLDLSHVRRWQTHPVAKDQSVAEHSYRVCIIALMIYEAMPISSGNKWPFEARLMRWALVHDGPEVKTGDLPNPAKRIIGREAWRKLEFAACPWYEAEVPPEPSLESVLVGLADTLEALSWLKRYGTGFKDRFNGEHIEGQLHHRIMTEAERAERELGYKGLQEAVCQVMKMVVP